MANKYSKRSADEEALYRKFMAGFRTGNWEGIFESDHIRRPFVITKREYEDHRKPIYACSFKPCWGDRVNDPAILATVGDNRLTIYVCPLDNRVLEPILLWTDTNPKPQTAREHGKPLEYEQYYSVEWVADQHEKEEYIVFGGENASIRVVNYTRRAFSHSMRGHGHIINEIKRHPVLPLIFASASRDATVRIWNVRLPFPLATILNPEGVHDQFLSLDWSWDGKFIVTGSMDHHIRLWKVVDKLEVRIETTITDNFDLFTSKKAEKKFSRLMGPGEVNYEIEEPIFIQMPCCETSDIHTNYVDCVRVFGNFIVSKSVENEVCVWKFGDFRDPLQGDTGRLGYNMPVDIERGVEDMASLVRTLDCPESDHWFCKYNIDPRRRIFVAGNRIGELRFYRLDQFKQEPIDEALRENHKVHVSNACIRDIAFEFFGRIVVAVADDGSVTRLDRVGKDTAKPPDDIGTPLTTKQIDMLVKKGAHSKISGRASKVHQFPDQSTKAAQYEKEFFSDMPCNAEEAGALARRVALDMSKENEARQKERRQLKEERRRARQELKAKKEKAKPLTKEEKEAAKAAAKEAADRARKHRAMTRDMQRVNEDRDRDEEDEDDGESGPSTSKKHREESMDGSEQPEAGQRESSRLLRLRTRAGGSANSKNGTELKRPRGEKPSQESALRKKERIAEATHDQDAAQMRAEILERHNYQHLLRTHPPGPSLADQIESMRKRIQQASAAANSSHK